MNRQLHGQSKPELEYIPADESSKFFSTHDLACAAALIECGYKLECLDKGDAKKVKFIFRGSSGIKDTIKDFWDGRLQVNAQGYFNATKRLKNQIYSE